MRLTAWCTGIAAFLTAIVARPLDLSASELTGGDARPVVVEGVEVHPQRLLVKYAPDLSADGARQRITSTGVRLLHNLPEIHWLVVQIPGRGVDALQAMRSEISGVPGVLRVDFDTARRAAYTPDDYFFPSQWHLFTMNVPAAWDTHRGDPAVRVAVIDTGVDYNHPDLAANIFQNTNEIAGNGLDDDANGYIDDIRGWDFAYNDKDPMDDYGHGTPCAGQIAAVQDNGIGVSGVAPFCTIVPIKAANRDGYFYDSATVPAYIYSANLGCRVFSMSYFTDRVVPAEEEALNYAWSMNVLPVAAAGNSAFVHCYYPAAYEHVMAVAATDWGNNRAWFSDFGSWVDVAAPGVGIWTTTVGGGYTDGFAGTSAATPNAAGVAALLTSAKPEATNDEIRAAIEDTATDLYETNVGRFSQYGLVDANAAIERLLAGSGSPRAAEFDYAAPVGGGPGTGLRAITIWGRGLEAANIGVASAEKIPMTLLSRERQKLVIGVEQGADPSRMIVRAGGSVIGSFPFVSLPTAGSLYVPTDFSTQGPGVPVLSGGFNEAITAGDGRVVKCSARDDGFLVMYAICQKVQDKSVASTIRASLTRKWTNGSGGYEALYLYDWSTGSYPYGSYIQIIGDPITAGSMETLAGSLTDAPKYIDDDGVIYLYLVGSGVGDNSDVEIDQLTLTVE